MMLITVLGLAIYSLARSGTILAAKSTGINRSHTDLRTTFDRAADHLLAANNVATLIGTDGNDVASGPAAGLKFDRVIGYPYVLDPPKTAGTIASTATSVSMWRSTKTDSGAPVPTAGDVLLIPTPTGNMRGQVKTITLGAINGTTQLVTLTFNNALGKSLSWGADQPQTVKLVRPEAFVVMPKGDRNELRYYPQFEPAPSLTDASKYVALTDQVGTQGDEGTPFSITEIAGDRIVQSTLRIRETQFNRILFNREKNTYSSYFQMLANMPSRLRPRTAN